MNEDSTMYISPTVNKYSCKSAKPRCENRFPAACQTSLLEPLKFRHFLGEGTSSDLNSPRPKVSETRYSSLDTTSRIFRNVPVKRHAALTEYSHYACMDTAEIMTQRKTV